MSSFFSNLQELQRKCGGVPQYVEWACARDASGAWQFYITQISDVNISSFPMQEPLGEYKSCGVVPSEVIGSGEQRGTKIFYIGGVRSRDDIENLKRFDAEARKRNEPYLLFFESSVLATSNQHQLKVEDFLGAGVALEAPDGHDHIHISNGSSLEGHFGGAIRQGNRIVATLKDYCGLDQEPVRSMLYSLQHAVDQLDLNGLTDVSDEYDCWPNINWLVRASEKDQQLVLAFAKEDAI